MNGIENITGVTSFELSKAVAGNAGKVSAAVGETNKQGNAENASSANQKPESSSFEKDLVTKVKSDENLQKEMAEKIEKYINNSNITVQFGVDKGSGKQYFKVVDKVENKVIKQFPPEEILALAERLREFEGSFVNAVV